MYIWPDKEIPQNKTLLMGLIVFSIWFNAIDFYSILYCIILLNTSAQIMVKPCAVYNYFTSRNEVDSRMKKKL